MNTRPKPTLNEFFVRGIPLATAVDVLSRWDSVTDDELIEIGFMASSEGPGRGLVIPARSSFH
jgi:hypothetical protein